MSRKNQILEKPPTEVSVETNITVLQARDIHTFKQLIGRFMAYVQTNELTKRVDMKTKLDNAES